MLGKFIAMVNKLVGVILSIGRSLSLCRVSVRRQS